MKAPMQYSNRPLSTQATCDLVMLWIRIVPVQNMTTW